MSNIYEMFGDYMYKETFHNPKRAQKILCLAYEAFGLKSKVFPNKNLSKANQYLANVTMDAIVKPFSHPENSVLTSIFFPSELIHAFGLDPLCAEQFSAYINGAKATRAFREIAEGAGIAETYCSYHKILMGASLVGVLPKPTCIVNTSIICDANNLTFRQVAQDENVPHYYVDVPFEKSETSVQYVTKQLEDLIPWLEEKTGRKLDWNVLKQNLVRSKETIDTIKETYTYRKNRYLPNDLTSELFQALAINTALGTPGALKFAQMLLEEYKQAPKSHARKIVWMHTNPQWQQPLKDIFNYSQDWQVIATDMCFATLDIEIDPEKPLESLARRMVYNTYNGHAQDRIQATADMVKKLDADGVICFCHWGCKETCGASAMIKNNLEAQGIPTLILNGDGVDPANSSDGQIQTRVEAFLEMLEDHAA